MRKRLYAYTKPNIISVRINDDEMESFERLIQVTNMKASELMRRAFLLAKERFEAADGVGA